MAIKHKHMSETVDDMTTGWRRILIGSGFFCLSVMMLWWWYCAIRATSPVVPEFLRTLVFARPRGDDQFADCTFSPSLDMSR